MRILFSHNKFPSQFRRLLPFFEQLGCDIRFISSSVEWNAPKSLLKYNTLYYVPSHTQYSLIHPYLRPFEHSVLEGQSAFRACHEFSEENWYPDYIISHAGFGNGFYLSDVFPDAKHLKLFEWYYNPVNSDVDFLNQSHPGDLDLSPRVKTLNSTTLLDFASCDVRIVPTNWQHSQFPDYLRPLIHVIHEGIDHSHLSRLRNTPSKPSFLPSDPNLQFITYVSRGFEEYRGFPQAVQAISRLLISHPNLHAILVGSDIVAYGKVRDDGRSWKSWAMDELHSVSNRVHWAGSVSNNEYESILSISDVHLYLTVPFILSWSLLEAMASKCPIVASDTPPVTEVLVHNRNSLLVNFFDVDQIVKSVSKLLSDKALSRHISQQASIDSIPYDCDQGCLSWFQLMKSDDAPAV